MCAATIETLTSPSSDQQDLAVNETIYIAYYFFEGGGTKRSSVIDMIRCLILQLSRYFEKLPTIITEFYDRFASDQTLKAEPSETECFDVLVGLLDLNDHTFLIIDAIDESNEKDLDELLSALTRISQHNPAQVRIICTSRPLRSIQDKVSHDVWKTVSLDSENTNEDIKLYIENALQVDSVLMGIDKAFKARISPLIVRSANGM